MDDETTRRAIDVVEQMAKKLGTTVEYLWPKAVEYTAAQAWGSVIASGSVLVLVAILAAATFIVIAKTVKNSKEECSEAFGVICVIVSIVTLIVGGIMLSNVCDAIPAIMAPEGATLMKMLEAAK